VTLSLGLLLSLLGLLSTRQSFAQAQFSSLDSFLHILAEENRFMGSLRLMRGDELLFERHMGFRDLEEGLSFDEDTKFRIGSVTKTFTSVLVLKAIEEGRLSLSDSIINYFPQIRHGGRIQIAHLLRLISGIHNTTAYSEIL